MTTIKFSDQDDLSKFTMLAHSFHSMDECDTAFFIPYWFKKQGDLTYEIHTLDILPEEMLEHIKHYFKNHL